MGTGSDSTISLLDEEESDEGRARRAACVTVAFQSDRPFEDAVRLLPRTVDEIIFGRARERGVTNEGRRLRVGLVDSSVSSDHARFVRAPEGWFLEDLKSKNGTIVNGRAVERQQLSQGDVIEIGRSVLTFAEHLTGEAEPEVLFASRLNAPSPELGSFLPSLRRAFDRLSQLANSEIPVFVHGETGTGKELAARSIHRMSKRSGAFVAVNCGALPPNLVEAELFGSKKGAFSGAVEDRPGLIRSADGGTLFLDEVGDLPLPSQAALLRALQEGEVLPVGATKAVKVDFRVVAATHRDLPGMVKVGRFRDDLRARLDGFTLRLPALRDRRDDLALLLPTLLRRVAPDPETVTIARRAARALFLYAWPRNIRELERALAAATLLAKGRPIDLEDLPPEVAQGNAGAPGEPRRDSSSLPPPSSAAEDELQATLVGLLQEHRGNVAAVARAMTKAPAQIHRWLKRFDLDLARFRGGDED